MTENIEIESLIIDLIFHRGKLSLFYGTPGKCVCVVGEGKYQIVGEANMFYTAIRNAHAAMVEENKCGSR